MMNRKIEEELKRRDEIRYRVRVRVTECYVQKRGDWSIDTIGGRRGA